MNLCPSLNIYMRVADIKAKTFIWRDIPSGAVWWREEWVYVT
jgi:hypothetical protein